VDRSLARDIEGRFHTAIFIGMFIIVTTYRAPDDEIGRHLAAHTEWFLANYESGLFLASGPRQPRTGAVILAAGEDRARLDAVLAQDPFAVAQLVESHVVQVTFSRAVPELQHLTG
jgi:uncharacterized protein YciI